MKTLDTLIVGGGVSGLATAWWLGKAGAAVEVWESSPRPGGKIQTDCCGGYRVEHAATMLIESDGHMREFLSRSGLERDRCSIASSKTRYLVSDGRLVGLPQTPAALLASPLWSRSGRLRMMLEPLVPRSRRSDETVREFITRRFGSELYEKAMEPYVSGPLASDPARACARSVLPRFTEMERRCGSITAGFLWSRLRRRHEACRAKSVTFKGGMQVLTDVMADDPTVGFKNGLRVTSIEPARGGWKVCAESIADQEVLVFARHLVLSTPAQNTAPLVSGFDPELAGLLNGITYAPLSVIHLGFNQGQIAHALDGAGFLVPQGEKKPVNGVLWMSSLVPDCSPKDKVLMTAYVGGARQPGAVQWSDERSLDAVLATLDDLVGIGGDPEYVNLIRHESALPQYVESYHARTMAIRDHLDRHASLHLSANYIGGVAVRDRIECARQCATAILERVQIGGEPYAVPAPMKQVCLSGA